MGLVSADEFKRKRVELESLAREAEVAKVKALEKERKRKGKERKNQMKSLSFSADDEDEEAIAAAAAAAPAKRKEPATSSAADGTAAAAAATDASTAAAASTSAAAVAALSSSSAAAAASSSSSDLPASKKVKYSNKDPTADTSFLPDRARELEEVALRARLEAEWKAKQEIAKKEQIQVVYSYWDGSGHRNKVNVDKGATIGQFLEKARKNMSATQHSTDWPAGRDSALLLLVFVHSLLFFLSLSALSFVVVVFFLFPVCPSSTSFVVLVAMV